MTKNKRWLIILTLCLLVATGFYVFKQKKTASKMSYREFVVTRGTINVTVLSTGIVQPQNRLEIKSPIAGRAETVLVQEGTRVKKGQIIAWMSSLERAALLDAARAKGAGELDKWSDYYKATPVVAPLSGTIILRNIEPGQSFSNQEAILVLADQLSVKAQVDETDLAQIRLQQKAAVLLDAFPEQRFQAIVKHIAFEARTVNNVTTYEVDVVPFEKPHFMRSGMTANVRFLIASQENVLYVPADAIKNNDNTSFVLKRSPSAPTDAPQAIAIVLGLSDGKRTEIQDGLAENDIVLIPDVSFTNDKKQALNPLSPFGRKH